MTLDVSSENIIVSPHIRESKTVLDSGFQAVNSRSQMLDSTLSVELGFRIPIVSRILDSKARDSGFQKQRFPVFQDPDSLTWGELCRIGVVSIFTLSRMSEVKKIHSLSFNSPEIKHLEDVGTISSWTGRQTVPTRLFKVAGLESWIKAMSLSSLLEEYPGWTITRLAFISCSVPSETRRLYSPKRTV